MKKALATVITISIIVQGCTAKKGYDYSKHQKRGEKAADYYRKGGGCKKTKHSQ
jgi:hypothetical protein